MFAHAQNGRKGWTIKQSEREETFLENQKFAVIHLEKKFPFPFQQVAMKRYMYNDLRFLYTNTNICISRI